MEASAIKLYYDDGGDDGDGDGVVAGMEMGAGSLRHKALLW